MLYQVRNTIAKHSRVFFQQALSTSNHLKFVNSVYPRISLLKNCTPCYFLVVPCAEYKIKLRCCVDIHQRISASFCQCNKVSLMMPSRVTLSSTVTTWMTCFVTKRKKRVHTISVKLTNCTMRWNWPWRDNRMVVSPCFMRTNAMIESFSHQHGTPRRLALVSWWIIVHLLLSSANVIWCQEWYIGYITHAVTRIISRKKNEPENCLSWINILLHSFNLSSTVL